MSRRRVPWDGPDPRAGDYLAGRVSGYVWLIRSVSPMRRANAFGERLTLDLAAVRLDQLPPGSTVHAMSRAASHDPAGPERVRQVAAGAAAVMRSRWRDPDDNSRSSRVPREVAGWRTFCVVRALARSGAPVTEQHILAADLLRREREIAVLGFSRPRDDLMPVSAIVHGPRGGVSDAAAAQAAASRAYARAVRGFDADRYAMIDAVIVGNQPLAIWVRRFAPPRRLRSETAKLIGILETLAERYASEIEADVARGASIA